MAAAEHWSENHVLPSLTAANTPNKGKPQHVQKLQFTKICFVLVFLHFSQPKLAFSLVEFSLYTPSVYVYTCTAGNSNSYISHVLAKIAGCRLKNQLLSFGQSTQHSGKSKQHSGQPKSAQVACGQPLYWSLFNFNSNKQIILTCNLQSATCKIYLSKHVRAIVLRD